MKFFRISALFLVLSLSLQSCKKDNESQWNVEIKNPIQTVDLTDISKELYDPNVSLEAFKQKYPWFQGSVSDADFELQRKDANEVKIYKDAIAKIDVPKLKIELAELFSHIQYYFPQFKAPKVFLYSSVLQSAKDPIFLKPQENYLFIDVTGFMGENNLNYKGLEQYFQRSMNPKNIIPKISGIFAEQFVPPNLDHQKFIDQMVYQGKIMILQDAFIPKEPDYLKINYDEPQYRWALENEVNIWDYFVENNVLFSDDPRLSERFIAPGPFSKFYTEVDNESSPQIAIFTGWQICKKFLQEKPETKLQNFLKMDAETIFNQSKYKPKFTE